MAALASSERPAGPEPESDSALFHRRIEFHQARKHFSGFVNESSNGFKLVTLNPSSDPVKASGFGKKAEKSSEHSEAGLDPELSFEITFRRIGAGLRNLGNTCFLNSVLQCLTYTAPLAAYLQSGKHQNSCRTAGFCALCAIQKHVSRALQSTGGILEPKDLVSNLRCISRSFRNARQEDAHEYMVNLLESMHKCCLPSGVPSESPNAYEKSLVHKIFGGRLRSQVKCVQCSYSSNKFDPFLDLSLEIVKADSLTKALNHFTAKEQLDGGAREYKCEQCKEKVKALKQLTVHKAPEVLTIHLKRFSALALGQKIDRKVAFGSTLDLKPFVTGPYDGELKYTLYGVLVHHGWSTHSGHYYCFVRTTSGMWYSLDDNQVVQVNERKVLEQKAYMLFYVRDRKNVGAKNHVNGIKKENMVMNAIGNAAYSKFNLELKERMQNDSNEKKSNGSFSGRNELVARLPTVENGKLTVENLGPVNNPKSESLKDNSSKGINCMDRKGGNSCSSADGSGATSNFGHVVGNITCNDKLTVAEEQNTTAVIMAVTGSTQDSLHTKESIKPSESAAKPLNSSVYPNGTISDMNASKIGPVGAIGESSSKINHVLSSPGKRIEDGQVGASSIKTVGPNTEKIVATEQTTDVQSKSDLPATAEPITKKKNRDLKVKGKPFKRHVIAKTLSSSIILGIGLCSRKKRHKQKRRHSMQKKHKKINDLSGENDSQSNPGQSTSEESIPLVVDHSISSGKKEAKRVSDGQNQNNSGDCSISGNVDNAEKQHQLRQSTAQRTAASKDVMSILTRGALDETTVPRWDDDNGVSLPEKREAGTVQIGYIGDEWDEEYDRGKRKKVRESKISFDGPNLFQQVANQKSRAKKKAKLERSRNGNQPFRI